LAADKGGPISRNMRWHPHLVRPEASGTAWEVPFSRVNSAAVPVFTPVELRKAPADRGATLLEFVPLANGGAANARVREEWLASSARGRPPLLALADVLGADALVVDGFVELLPTADKPPFRRAEVIELSRRQIAEELRLAAPERAGPHRFLGFEALAGFDAKAGLRDAPESVRRLDGASVVMVGRMVPVDEVVAMSQFLLSQDEWGDDWGRPPTLADVVLVQAPATGRIDCARAAVRVHGTLRVKEQREDGELVGIYRLEAERVELVE
jgi:hypothetical protein